MGKAAVPPLVPHRYCVEGIALAGYRIHEPVSTDAADGYGPIP